MAKVIDKKKYPPKCEYCIKAHIPDDRSIALCGYFGVMELDACCKHYKYDPLKRVPVKIKISSDFSEEEFKL